MSFHEVLSSLQEIGGLLVKRGTVMGPLVLPLVLSPVLFLFAWLFESTLVIKGIPLISSHVCVRRIVYHIRLPLSLCSVCKA